MFGTEMKLLCARMDRSGGSHYVRMRVEDRDALIDSRALSLLPERLEYIAVGCRRRLEK